MQGCRRERAACECARGLASDGGAAALYYGDVTFVDSPEGLRASVALDGKGAGNVVVGPVENGVSDVNLAAAIVCDQQADQVVLVRENASGSLLSRARRAGISDVIDPGAYGPDVGGAVEEQVDVMAHYDGYIEKQNEQVRRFRAMEELPLPKDLDYMTLDGLRLEARQKLNAQRPDHLGQASRISGVSPADVAVLLVYLKRGFPHA